MLQRVLVGDVSQPRLPKTRFFYMLQTETLLCKGAKANTDQRKGLCIGLFRARAGRKQFMKV